jgi:hypothetical protein
LVKELLAVIAHKPSVVALPANTKMFADERVIVIGAPEPRKIDNHNKNPRSETE